MTLTLPNAPTAPPAAPNRAALALADCAACPLLPGRNPVLGDGPAGAALAVVGEGPGHTEARLGRPFAGASGRLLDATLAAAGTQRSAVYATNVVACRSTDEYGDDAPPPPAAVACCRPRLLAELHSVNPKLILSLGASAARALLQTKQGINEVNGVVEHRDALPAPVLPTFHPAAVLHAGAAGEEVFERILSATKRAVRIASGELTLPPRDEEIPYRHITTARAAEGVIADIALAAGKRPLTLALDLETGGLDVVSDRVLQVAIGNAEHAVVIEYEALDASNLVFGLFQDLLRRDSITWLVHNSAFDLQFLEDRFGVVPPNVVDTLCLALGGTERGAGVGLKRLAREWLNAPYYEAEVHQYLPTSGTDWGLVPRAVLAKYAAKDIVYTARLHPILTDLCRKEGTLDLAHGLLMPAQRAFAQVERHGVLVDRAYLAGLEEVWQPKIDAAVRAIEDYARAQGWARAVPAPRKEKVVVEVAKTKMVWFWVDAKGKEHRVEKPKNPPPPGAVRVEVPAGTKRRTEFREVLVEAPLNPRSPAQLAAFLYDHLRLFPPGGERTTGQVFRDAYPNHRFTALQGEFQLADHMMRSYVRGIADDVRADGRVHPSFKLWGAVTGRLAMERPPLQTIPREDLVEGRFDSIKRIFVPSPGHVWLEVDYRQLELRVAWHLSEDGGLGEAIMSGDFHRVMASRVFGYPEAAITSAMRHDSKRITFGIMYGRQAPAIAGQIGCPVEVAQGYVDGFFAAAPKYRAWYRAQHLQALTQGRSVTPFGRVRRWGIVIDDKHRQAIRNQAVNFPVQSLASDLTLNALVKLTALFRGRGLGHVLFAVHDSLCFEVEAGREAEAVALVRDVMTTWPFASCATLDVEAKVGPSWGEVKEWDG